MKNYSLNSFYDKINKNILLVESYSEQTGLAWIIKASRLKPEKLEPTGIKLYKKWIDEFHNSLSIIKDKKIKIVIGDLSVPECITTDLYYGLSVDKISKISKLLYICYGKDDDEYNKMYYLAFLGLDNYLRCFMHLGDSWQRVSPVMLGTSHLKNICQNLDARYFKEFSNKEKMTFPCISGQAWLTCLPASAVFYRMMEKEHDALVPFFNYKKDTK
jgi:hypothetical protein